ncbi:hypothetical protein D3C72_2202300 [compost metagenome]
MQRERGAITQHEGNERGGECPDHRVDRNAPEHLAGENGRVVVGTDKDLVAELKPGRCFEE